uniref:Uncharacterized protein n=1 Tax=Arundo donax TaxID=35708 RepID=A0A0A9CZA9_ARUDO
MELVLLLLSYFLVGPFLKQTVACPEAVLPGGGGGRGDDRPWQVRSGHGRTARTTDRRGAARAFQRSGRRRRAAAWRDSRAAGAPLLGPGWDRRRRHGPKGRRRVLLCSVRDWREGGGVDQKQGRWAAAR